MDSKGMHEGYDVKIKCADEFLNEFTFKISDAG